MNPLNCSLLSHSASSLAAALTADTTTYTKRVLKLSSPSFSFTPSNNSSRRHSRTSSADSDRASLYYLALDTSPLKTSIVSLVEEVLLLVFSFLDTKSLISSSLVSKHFHHLLQDNIFWLRQCHQMAFKPVTKWKSRILPVFHYLHHHRHQNHLQKYTRNLHSSMIMYKSLDLSPWKAVYRDCVLTGLNWKSGRCSINQVSDPMHKGKLCVSFDEDSAVSVTLGQEGKLWDMRTGETKLNLGGHHGIITTVRVASKIVVSGSVDCTLKIFDKQTGSCLDTLIGHDGEIVSVHYKDGGDIIVSGSEDHTIRIWVKNIHYSTSPQSAIASPLPAHPPPNPFSHKLPQDWQQFRILRGHSDAVTCLHFDDSHIVSGSADHTIRIWNFNSSRCLTTLNGHQGSVFCLQFNNQFIVSGGADAKICVWKWRREMSSDGNSKSMNVALYRVLDGQMGHESAVVCLQFDKDKIVSGSTDNSIKVWDLNSCVCLYTLNRHTGPIWNLKITPTKIISSSFDHSLLVWDFAYFADDEEE